MSHFEYEKPSAVEISERELSEIAAVLYSSGGGTAPIPIAFDEYVTSAAGFPDDTAGNMLSLLATLIDRQFSGKTAAYRAWLFFRVIGGFSYKDEMMKEIVWEAVADPLPYDYEQAPGGAVTCMRLGCRSLAKMTDSQWFAHIASSGMYADTHWFYRVLNGDEPEPSA